MTINEATEGREYIIRQIESDDEEMKSFLFTLGCYEGEKITLKIRRRGVIIINIKDAKYSIDRNLAEAIKV